MRWSPEVEEALAVLREKLGEDGLLAAAKLIQASDRELRESQRRLEEKMDGLGRRMDEFQRDVTARLDGFQRDVTARLDRFQRDVAARLDALGRNWWSAGINVASALALVALVADLIWRTLH